MKVAYSFFGFIVLYLMYWFSPLAYSSVCGAAKDAMDEGDYRVQDNNPGRDCRQTYAEGNYSDCLKKNGELKKVEYIPEDNVVSAIYRCEAENGYIGEMRITEHLSLSYNQGYDCHFVMFKNDKNIPVGEAASTYWTP